ncbi:MAG: DEAD/DEAH box helicase [candidate division NC10 bacterium]
MTQEAFEWGIPDPPARPPIMAARPDPQGKLRYYQTDCVRSIFERFEEDRATLAVLATGLGKTEIFSHVAKEFEGSVLILAHRDELVEQAKLRLERMTGEFVEVEKASRTSSESTRIVVGSVQSMSGESRLNEFDPERFDLIICDEAHHYVAKTYRRPLEYFANAKVLGVTATPDRADELALGMIFESPAYVMDITDGIEAGYLVDVKGQSVYVDEIDLSQVSAGGKAGKDLNIKELDMAMCKAVEPIVRETLKYEPDRQGIVFMPGVRSAQYAAEKFNSLLPNSAVCIHGGTPENDRRGMVERFKQGAIKYLCNCMIATEGFDAPATSLIVQARPTKSRALCCQMVGRGTRVLPNTVEHLEGAELAEQRREAIASSDKPDCMILDFVGNAGRHSLISPVDVLAGNYDEDVVARAKKKVEREGGGSLSEALMQAKMELDRLKQTAAATRKATVKSRSQGFDPFALLQIDPDEGAAFFGRFGDRPATEKQESGLKSWGAWKEGLSKNAASRLMGTLQKRQKLGLATPKQLKVLQQYGVNQADITKPGAGKGMTYLKSIGYGKRSPIDRTTLMRLVTGERQPGEEG